MRILFFVALGGAITLGILAATGSNRFGSWALGFIIATPLLCALWALFSAWKRNKRTRTQVAAAQVSGRVRAALILDRHQTGLFVNEQPQIEFTLLVDRPDEVPFVTKAREIVQLTDLHEVTPGEMLAVAHVHPQLSDVHIIRQPVPTPSKPLTREAAETAEHLPSHKEASPKSPLATLAVILGSFLLGAIGAPFLATPHVLEYVSLIGEGRTDEVHRIDHPVLFEADQLLEAIDRVTTELGHDEVSAVTIAEVSMTVEVPADAAGDDVDDANGTDDANNADAEAGESVGDGWQLGRNELIRVQDHRIVDREQHIATPIEEAVPLFQFSEVNWAAVLESAPTAAQVAAQRGLEHPKLERIRVDRDSSGFARIQVSMHFANELTSQTVHLDSEGELLASEHFSLLPENEKKHYLHDEDRLQDAVRELTEHLDPEQIVRVVSYGDRALVDGVLRHGDSAGRVATVDFREGLVHGVDEPEKGRVSPDEVFRFDDINWAMVPRLIFQGQGIMAESGVGSTEPTHIIIERTSGVFDDDRTLYIRVYLKNEFDEGGYVEFHTDGSIKRISGPWAPKTGSRRRHTSG